jgi:hypothetical protein
MRAKSRFDCALYRIGGDGKRQHAGKRGVVGTKCEFRRNPATDSDLKPATVPI